MSDTREPLYKVQARALVDPRAARECAERYADMVEPTYGSVYGIRYRNRIVKAYQLGLDGGEARYWSNYERPLRRAHRDGYELRSLLLEGTAFRRGDALPDATGTP
jgi:hypothetical protein